MQQNPGIKIEIGGHTDDKGSDDYNLTLSEGRAQSVKDYLIEKGIAADRMTAKGYGETEPISSNATDQGRAENRRVEFTILAVE
jgi:outer membrane protein OmpA-like peptidoglycan-associated protein